MRFLPMRLPLLVSVLLATLGYTHAADWQVLSDTTVRALHRTHSASETTAVPQIINGAFTAAYPAVARLNILTPNGGILCSGTLVSPSTILTAAHCVADGPLGIDADFFPTPTSGTSYAVVAYAIHPEYRYPVADLAILWLEAPVVGIAPLPLAEWEPRPRTVGTIVGYGFDEVGNLGVEEMGFVRLKRCPRRVRAFEIWPGDLARSLCWSRRPWQQDTCHGDSGGPLLIGEAVAGVTSGGDPNCTGFLSWDTSVVPFLPWITSMLL